MLLTRTQFREGVFARDNHTCVICQSQAQDAHHIMERRLWPDGGYYLDNGASLCGQCHILAEQTHLSCEEIRSKANIHNIVLPPHLYRDQTYDKWGNIINADGTRTKGELYYDPSVYKVLEDVRKQFQEYIKYPRTFHLPDSPGKTKDDRVMEDAYEFFKNKPVVITEKMDGENTTIYHDGYCHARSIDSKKHPSRSWIKNFASQVGYGLPTGWRLCGENLWARHSIPYYNLEDYFLGFSLWDSVNICQDWYTTCEWFELLNIKPVRALYIGEFDLSWLYNHIKNMDTNTSEGFVIRLYDAFRYSDFRRCVAKWVRPNHVQSSHNWMREEITKNTLHTDRISLR